MLKKADHLWEKYVSGIVRKIDIYDPPFADNLDYIGHIKAHVDYVPSDEFFESLRAWLLDRHEERLLYFLTEAVKGENTSFELGIEDLDRTTLTTINPGYCNLFVGVDFSWAIFIDDEGNIHVAGNRHLFRTFEQFF
ncbi:MAG: hypothetical protein WBD22_13155 [Pyrinomonadaceae bacterium]